MKITYSGSYPNLCRGKLTVVVGGTEWVFPACCMVSGGSTWFTNGYATSHISGGEWSIDDWPTEFPEELKQSVVDAVNDTVPFGCCGGCL